jgi:hypothetical protein
MKARGVEIRPVFSGENQKATLFRLKFMTIPQPT